MFGAGGATPPARRAADEIRPIAPRSRRLCDTSRTDHDRAPAILSSTMPLSTPSRQRELCSFSHTHTDVMIRDASPVAAPDESSNRPNYAGAAAYRDEPAAQRPPNDVNFTCPAQTRPSNQRRRRVGSVHQRLPLVPLFGPTTTSDCFGLHAIATHRVPGKMSLNHSPQRGFGLFRWRLGKPSPEPKVRGSSPVGDISPKPSELRAVRLV